MMLMFCPSVIRLVVNLTARLGRVLARYEEALLPPLAKRARKRARVPGREETFWADAILVGEVSP